MFMFCHYVGNGCWEASDAAESAGVELTLRGSGALMDLHKLLAFSVHSPTHPRNTRTQMFVEVLQSLTYCIEVLL